MRPVKPNGFILLEVLVAMSLILGAWMASLASYQGIALRHGQQASKRQVLRLKWDQHELQEQARSQGAQKPLPNQPHLVNQGKKNEFARMPSRNRPVRAIAQSTIAHQRTNGQTTN
jgi:Tfp pilus assembly protein PilV